MKQQDRCYICGDSLEEIPRGYQGDLKPKHRTKDHVPPDGLFCDPKPTNLITVGCCNECNRKHSNFDDQLRALCAMELGANDIGKRVMHEKVIGSTMRNLRQREFMTGIHETMRPEKLNAGQGEQEVVKFSVNRSTVCDGIINIVKGLLTYFYPNFDYHQQTFLVMDIHSSTAAKTTGNEELKLMRRLEDKMPREIRGAHKEFQFWRQIEINPLSGAWLLRFYDGISFVVIHHSDSKKY